MRVLPFALMSYARFILIVCLFLCSLPHSQANQDWVTVGIDNEKLILGTHLYVLVDPDNQFKFEQIKQPEILQRFIKSNEPNLKFGFSSATYWLHTTLKNESSEANNLYLESDYPLLDYFDVYVEQSNGEFDRREMGDRLPFENRDVKHRNIITIIQFQPGEAKQVFIRVKSQSSIQINLELHSIESFYLEDHEEQIVLGMYYGLVLVMLVYNILIFGFLREINYGYYSIYIFSYMMFQLSLNGLTFEYLWPNSPVWNNFALPVFAGLSAIGMALFFCSFLQIKSYFPRIQTLFHVLNTLFLGIISLSLFAPYSIVMQLSAIMALIFAVVFFTVGIYAWSHNVSWAKYFIVSFSVVLLGVIVYVLKALGFLPKVFVTEYAIQIGSVLQIIGLSVAIAVRIKQLVQENSELELVAKRELESKVEEKTLALKNTMQQLEVANQELLNQTIIDELTQMNNRRFFDNQLSAEWANAKRHQNHLSLAIIDLDHFKSVNDQYGHSVGDRCLQLVAEQMKAIVNRATDSVARYGGEEFVAILPDTDEEGASQVAESLRTKIESHSFLIDDLNLSLTTSIGVATVIPDEISSTERLFRLADHALYKAKSAGRNCVIAHQPDQKDVNPKLTS